MKPLVKWVGGKTRIMKKIIPLFPKNYKRYFEPFAGGAAIALHLNHNDTIISDSNVELMNFYSVVRDDVKELMYVLKEHENTKEYYYSMRSLDRDKEFFEMMSDLDRASRFLYLNKTCFNGLWRVNAKHGYNNTPYAYPKTVKLFDVSNMHRVSEFLNSKCSIKCCQYSDIGEFVEEDSDDFVYIDPPYDETFGSYTQEGFKKSSQLELSKFCKALDKKNVKFCLSNKDTDDIRGLYKKFDIINLSAVDTVSGRNSGRGKRQEVLIRNYKS